MAAMGTVDVKVKVTYEYDRDELGAIVADALAAHERRTGSMRPTNVVNVCTLTREHTNVDGVMVPTGWSYNPTEYTVPTTTPSIGRIVHVHLGDGSLARTFASLGIDPTLPVAAIVTHVWNERCINARLIADGQPGPHEFLTSIVRQGDASKGATSWAWPKIDRPA